MLSGLLQAAQPHTADLLSAQEKHAFSARRPWYAGTSPPSDTLPPVLPPFYLLDSSEPSSPSFGKRSRVERPRMHTRWRQPLLTHWSVEQASEALQSSFRRSRQRRGGPQPRGERAGGEKEKCQKGASPVCQNDSSIADGDAGVDPVSLNFPG